MAAIAVTDVQIHILPTANPAGAQSADQIIYVGKMKMSRVKFSISATKALTYPSSGGIPLPTFNATQKNGDSSFGMVRNVSHINFYSMGGGYHPSAANRSEVHWKYDARNHVIRGHWITNLASNATLPDATGMTELPTTWKPSMSAPSGADQTLDFYAEVYGW